MTDVDLDSPLEQTLVDLAEESNNASEFLGYYKQTKNHLEDEMYPWVQSNCNWFTDHGKQHITAVINQSSRLLKNELRDIDSGDIDELDIYALLTAILWHDVGMIVHRADHERISTEVADEFKDIAFPTTAIKATIDDIVKAHRNESGLDIPQRSSDFNYNGEVYKIYPKSLAAILRFADEISETQERVSGSSWVRSTVPHESRIFWRYAETIQGCYPDLNGKTVKMNIELDSEQAVTKYLCPDSFENRQDDNEEITLIEYVVCRLEKLVNELTYCERYFNRYTEMREVEVDITVRGESNDIEKGIKETLAASGLTSTDSYPNLNIFEEFFDQHNQWRPSQLRGDSV